MAHSPIRRSRALSFPTAEDAQLLYKGEEGEKRRGVGDGGDPLGAPAEKRWQRKDLAGKQAVVACAEASKGNCDSKVFS